MKDKGNIFSLELFRWNNSRTTLVMPWLVVEKLPHKWPLQIIGIRGKFETREFHYHYQNSYMEHIYFPPDQEASNNTMLVLIQTLETYKQNNSHRDRDIYDNGVTNVHRNG